jgi:hypothetical protein
MKALINKRSYPKLHLLSEIPVIQNKCSRSALLHVDINTAKDLVGL